MRRFATAIGVVTPGLLLCGVAFAAQRAPEFPASRPIRLLVPFAPGGGADLVARLVSGPLTERLGQSVVVDNRPAASGVVAAELAARAAPDGHTLLVPTSNLAASPAMFRKLPYSIERDFAPVTLAVVSPLVMVIHPSVPVATMKEFLAYARANPGKLNYGSSGPGGPPHIAGELMKSMAGIDMTHIVYKGIAPAVTSLLANEVQVSYGNVFIARPHVQSGRLKALAVTSLKRSAAAPELPTVDESGLPGYEAGIWYGFMLPAATPRPIVERLHRELTTILRQPEIAKGVVAQGGDVVASTPAEFDRLLRADIARLGKVIRDAGIKPE